MHRAASQFTAFDIYRSLPVLTKKFSLTNAFAELVDLARSSIAGGSREEALSLLNQLKESLQLAKDVIDGRPQMLLSHVMTVKVLQLENCQLRLELARSSGDEDAIRLCEERLKTLDLYVSSATADLAN